MPTNDERREVAERVLVSSVDDFGGLYRSNERVTRCRDCKHYARTASEVACSLFVSIAMFAAIVLLEPIVEMLL